mmetsp:Transcript_43929/g.64544  ORF Transcript_43929/g.64544 Transcript_43929/m.64544 type:complete len:85 (+) Transcript_43929:73-327(+)
MHLFRRLHHHQMHKQDTIQIKPCISTIPVFAITHPLIILYILVQHLQKIKDERPENPEAKPQTITSPNTHHSLVCDTHLDTHSH